MTENDITIILAISLLIALLIYSVASYFLKLNKGNIHLKTYDEDIDLYFYKNKKSDIILTTNIPDEPKEELTLNIMTKGDLTNDEEWMSKRTSFKKDFIIYKIKEVEASQYTGYFHIKDLITGKKVKDRYLTSDKRTEDDNINTIQSLITNNGNYEILYIGRFGFISHQVIDVFDIK